MTAKISVIYYSATGNVHQLAKAIEKGAIDAGAEVRVRRVAELAPEQAIQSNPAWAQHVEETRDIPTASLDDLEWADAYVFGTPTRFGSMTSQLKQFIDTAGGLWAKGALADKVAGGFVSASTLHGGHESTLLSMYNVFMHWGSVLVPPGYTDDAIHAAGGNPYGAGALGSESGPTDAELRAAGYYGSRIAAKAAKLAA
ncbi:NAD(P)H:quinone oxidoreductase [Saccharopolyspora shandongensis]|uniref:NAD(P)H:quinone oxidoreductase n=1 Tax=Saccharopolyspora shandongensis TaxID=418495 RepID=UPI0033C7BB4B